MANGKMKIQLDSAGVREILRSDGARGACETQASKLAAKAEGNWEVESGTLRTRAYARAVTADKDTYYRDMNRNYMLKAMGRGGK